MQTFEKAPTRDTALIRKLARSLFTAKSEMDVAGALLALACEVSPRGGAVYFETDRGFRRAAASGTGLALPAETDMLQRAALTVHRHGACALVHDTLDGPSEDLLGDAVSLAGAALDEVAAKAALRARSRQMADRVTAVDERASALAQTVEGAMLDAMRELLGGASIEIVEGDVAAPAAFDVPLRLDGTTIGVLRVTVDAPRHLRPQQRQMLERVAPKLAVAVALARRIAQS